MDGGKADAAERLMREHAEGVTFHGLAAEYGIGGLDDAYAVQRRFVALQKAARHARSAGYKVGLTSPRMQAMCGIDSPIAGVVLGDRVQQSGARLKASGYGRLGLEFEIAVRLGRALHAEGGEPSLDEVDAAVEAVAPAFEIVDDRRCDYASLELLSLVADNSWNAGVVLGEFRTRWPDLASLQGTVEVDGVETDRGTGADVLGHPYRSIAWLAAHLAAGGEHLRPGDIVMTGNWVTTKFPPAPSRHRFVVPALGAVELSIEA